MFNLGKNYRKKEGYLFRRAKTGYYFASIILYPNEINYLKLAGCKISSRRLKDHAYLCKVFWDEPLPSANGIKHIAEILNKIATQYNEYV